MSVKRIHTVIPEPAAATGSWKDKDHPELRQGAAKWVDKLRAQDESRFQKVTLRASAS